MGVTVLRGPADADHYRVKQGRYGDRWYTDPLPGCPIADASDWTGPSWSIVKGAAGKDWSYVTNKRNGHTPTGELQRIATLEPDARTAAFNQINKSGLSQAGGRGTIVHLWAEDLLAGHSPRLITEPALFALKLPKAALEEALTYLPALSAFFDHYQPEVIAAEYVAIHRTLNGHGYGCTPDVIAHIQGQTLGVDWKTRGVDSDHGAYPEEAAQIAAGAKAEYMIITSQDEVGRPMRAYIPQIDAGIVVSIRPDGARIYPIDLAPAWDHVQAMHAFWVARLSEKDSLGKPWPPIAITQQEDLWNSTPDTPSKPSKSSKTASNTPGTSTNRTSPPPTATTASATTPTETTASTTTAAPSPSTAPTDEIAVPSASVPRAGEGELAPEPSPANPFTSAVLADAIAGWPLEARGQLKEWWPPDYPTPGAVRRGEAVWTEQQIDHIGQMCDLADAPFWHTTTPPPSRFAGSGSWTTGP